MKASVERLLADPHAALEEELGARLPKEVEVRAVEETPDTIYLVLPAPRRSAKAASSQKRIESVAGGGWGQPLCPYHTASTSGC